LLAPSTAFAELQQQNQELLRTLGELRARQEELTRLNSELEDTNRGVVALYAELDEKAGQLQRANELKTRFLSNMGHEFRAPVNSILALSRLLLGRLSRPDDARDEWLRGTGAAKVRSDDPRYTCYYYYIEIGGTGGAPASRWEGGDDST
jgi:signal transduction histidine kinase